MNMLNRLRSFWFNNVSGVFDLAGRSVTRQEIHTWGGPSPEFACEVCQRLEWLSRLDQVDRYELHKCATSKECSQVCSRQGDSAWSNYHQNHWFAAVGCDDNLNAPKGALVLHESASQYKWFWLRNCNAGMYTFRQKLAYACQVDTEVWATENNWSKYDFLWHVNKNGTLFDKKLPMILYCHDMWRGNKQEMLDHFKPEVILTPYPTPWKQNFEIPKESRVVFSPACPSEFFIRSNLVPESKTCDLLVIGIVKTGLYKPRVELNWRLSILPDRYIIEHSHKVGCKRGSWLGPVDDEHPYLNKWSELLGSARFVIFGPCGGRAKEMLLIKYYECLASGAIPIMPEVEDLALLGIEPMIHYIPLHLVWDRMDILAYLLDHYDGLRYIAENAVQWYKDNVHSLTFERFENTVHSVVEKKYPKRRL